MFNQFERFFSSIRKKTVTPNKPHPYEVEIPKDDHSGVIMFGDIAVKVPDTRVTRNFPYEKTSTNLLLAESEGVKPLSLNDVLSQMTRKQLDSALLFDTPPSGIPGGNHWRIIDVDPKGCLATIQLCGIFANYDYKQIPTIKLPLETPFFTGLSYIHVVIDGQPATVAQLTELTDKHLKDLVPDFNTRCQCLSRDTYLSNGEGTLKLMRQESLTF